MCIVCLYIYIYIYIYIYFFVADFLYYGQTNTQCDKAVNNSFFKTSKKIKNICIFLSLTFQSRISYSYLLRLVVAQGQMYGAPGENQTH